MFLSCIFTLVLQQQVLVQLVENPQPPEVAVVLQVLEQQQQVREVAPQEQIHQKILDLGLGPVHHHQPLLALHHPLRSRDRQLASEQFWCCFC